MVYPSYLRFLVFSVAARPDPFQLAPGKLKLSRKRESRQTESGNFKPDRYISHSGIFCRNTNFLSWKPPKTPVFPVKLFALFKVKRFWKKSRRRVYLEIISKKRTVRSFYTPILFEVSRRKKQDKIFLSFLFYLNP